MSLNRGDMYAGMSQNLGDQTNLVMFAGFVTVPHFDRSLCVGLVARS